MLLFIIYLTFVSLGLPDSALGSAWPSMYGPLDAGVSWQGLVAGIISAGTIISSIFSTKIVGVLGTGKTTLVSVVLTAAALIGFSTCSEFWQLCVWAVPYGLGAGAIDAALNSYVALHLAARHMSWLHCMWGIGASVGPVIMAWRIAASGWEEGFFAIGAIQIGIALIVALSLPLWKRTDASEQVHSELGAAKTADKEACAVSDAESDTIRKDVSITPAPQRSRRELLAMPGVVSILVCFFCYCALETTCGAWAASFCTLVKGISTATAASWASLFYVGITLGRLASGFATWRLSDKQLIRLGQLLIALGVALIALPLSNAAVCIGLIICGVGCAPVYPSIIHCTPAYFGRDFALALTGMQMAFAYVGSLIMSPLFGVLAQWISPALYPFYLLGLLLLMIGMSEHVNRTVAARSAAASPQC